MEQKEFREWAHRLADWMADYMEKVSEYPVLPNVEPGDILRQLPDRAPSHGEPMEAIFRDFEQVILPGMTHWQHPRFFGYFPASRSAPSVLAEMLTATLGAQCMIWLTSPAAEELETRCMDWLRDMIGLPSSFVGSIQETASAANLIALLMARERITRFRARDQGMFDLPTLRVYASEHIHSSVVKAARIAGFGEDNVVLVAADENFAMDVEALERCIRNDLIRGYRPTCIVAALGTTSSTAIDPLPAIARISQRYKVFLHVDAAYAGTALILPELRWMIEGIEGVDSFVFNPHKWMFVNFDCTAFFVQDPQLLVQTFAIHPEYLRTGADQQVRNYRDWGIQLGRRFRALKLWFVIRSYGVEGLRAKISQHLAQGQWFAQRVDEAADFERLAPVPLNLVCFRYHPTALDTEEALDALNQQLLDRLNASGKLFITHTRLAGRLVLRFVPGQTETTMEDIKFAWAFIAEQARQLEPNTGA